MISKALRKDQQGAAHAVAVLVVVIVAVVGFAGYSVMNGGSKKEVVKTPVTTTKTTAPATFTSKADAQQAVKALDNDKLDQNLDTSALDSDIDALL